MYHAFITIEDIRNEGYDLLQDGMLELGSFSRKEDAANNLIKQACDRLGRIIARNRGKDFAVELHKEFALNPTKEMNVAPLEALKEAQVLETLFLLDYGLNSKTKDDNSYKDSPEAVETLYQADILRWVL